MFDLNKKVGVLGGGQLGKMMALAAGNWHLPICFLDSSEDFPAGPFSFEFTEGDFNNYEDVYAFGKDKDVLTIEIEHVNTAALHQLKKEGKKVHPDPEKLDIIKDKGLQKLFYQEHNIPTAPFRLFEDENAVKEALKKGEIKFPFVQKSRTAGYDGKGVAVIREESDWHKVLPGACLIEEMAPIEKELAVVVARNESGEVKTYPAVEMEFHPVANLVEFLACPADISEAVEKEAEEIAMKVIDAFQISGLLAVELFLNKDGSIWVNEVAPRPHNSGHHTIDSCYTSQFEQHLRGILDLPLGSTKMKSPSIMVNLLGADGFTGPAHYEGMDKCLALEGVKMHLYGKSTTKPFRKMGHATLLGESVNAARDKARFVQNNLIIKTK
ncbi:MAG: 5-(carboxyamino)imidazole ribonucleotide synthase [Saprospiraceae bacterium]